MPAPAQGPRPPGASALLATALVALVALGCAATGRRHRPPPAAARAAAPAVVPLAPSGAFRWLVPTAGPPVSVAAENRRPGTRAWRLPGPRVDRGGVAFGDVHGYVSDPAVMAGQIERVYVSAPGAPYVRIRVFRIGWYGGAGGREVLASRRLRLVAQPPCAHRPRTGLTECRWHPTLSFQIPSGLTSGVYVVRLDVPRGASDCLFVVRAREPAPLLVQLPTATYEAYNAWGGDSLYPGGADRVGITHTTQGVEVSYDRPYDSLTGAGQLFARDVAMVWFLERYGYPVSYTTSESVDEDPGQLMAARAILDFGHSEYWSERQAEAFARARDAGRSLLFLSSDTLAWRIRFARADTASSSPGAPDHVIVAYKEHAALDPDFADPTGPFPAGGASLTGSAYLGCITPRVPGGGPPVYRYYSWRPAPGLTPRWLFAHTGITATTSIPGIVGYELDARTAASPPGTRVVGFGPAVCMRPAGESAPGRRPPEAQSTIYTTRAGGLVFAAGTLGWELGLEPVPSASPDAPRAPDPRLVRLTRNLLGRALRAR